MLDTMSKFLFNTIEAQYGSIQIKTIAVDFTEGQSIYPKLKAELNQLEIGILVNNVGMLIGFDPYGDLEDDRELHNIVNCNILSMVCSLFNLMLKKRIIFFKYSTIDSYVPHCLTSNGETEKWRCY